MQAFENFWNMWASRQRNLTKRTRLLPFNLSEMEAYLKSRKIKLDQFQLLQHYIAMGGGLYILKRKIKEKVQCKY